MIRVRRQCLDRLSVAAELVGDDNARSAELSDHTLQESLRRLRVPARLEENVQNVTICVKGAPEPMLHAVDRDHNLVEMPLVRGIWPIATNTVGEMRAETIDPKPDCFPAYDHATLGKQILDICRAQREPMVNPDRVDACIFMFHPVAKSVGPNNLAMPVDRNGRTLDFLLSEHRDLAAARRFFKRAIGTNGMPDRVVIDKSGANLAGLRAVNVVLKFTSSRRTVEIRQVKYLNNILEQDHRFIKWITNPMMGFKAFHSASATIAGIEFAHMIRKGQFPTNETSAFRTFAALAA